MYEAGQRHALTKLGLTKSASISMKRLRALTQGEAPLFHMVSPENVPGFLESGAQAVPALASKARGKLQTYEGDIGTARSSVSTTPTPTGAENLRVPMSEMMENVEASNVFNNRASMLGAMSVPGVTGNYALAQNMGRLERGAGKNWGTISFTREPSRAYGDVGLMTSPSQIQGRVAPTQHPTRPGPGGQRVPNEWYRPEGEVQAGPTRQFNREGLVENIRLPSAEGTIVYDPQSVTREVARDLKARGGIALNRRLRARLKRLNKETEVPVPARGLGEGNILWPDATAGREQQLRERFKRNIEKATKIYPDPPD